MYDPITTKIDDYALSNAAAIERLGRHQGNVIFRPPQKYHGRTLSGSLGFKLLTDCFHVGEAEFRRITSDLPKDAWFAYMRRLPIFDPDLLGLITLGLIKHSNVDFDLPLVAWPDVATSTDRFLSEEILESIFQLKFTASAMLEVARFRRMVGKGAHGTVGAG